MRTPHCCVHVAPPAFSLSTPASTLASTLTKLGHSLVSGGTDNHLVLMDVKKSHGVDGARFVDALGSSLDQTVASDRLSISLNSWQYAILVRP